jgi:hypothetical protein
MALSGELSDLSLAELIELFCNRRKTGRLEVVYPIGAGSFYLHAGALVHAQIGELRGIEAVYCALTLPNASFTFDQTFAAPELTINAPWTSVVLEGLRRIDEGIVPPNPFPHAEPEDVGAAEPIVYQDDFKEALREDRRELKRTLIPLAVPQPPEMPAFLAQAANDSLWREPRKVAPIAAAVVLVMAVIGVPWGMYARNRAAKLAAAQPVVTTGVKASEPTVPTSEASATPSPAANDK